LAEEAEAGIGGDGGGRRRGRRWVRERDEKGGNEPGVA
jgi:hypothetical protein